MKKITLIAALSLAAVSADAQVLADGYYRVQNSNTKRWAVLADDKAYVDENVGGVGAVNLEAIRTYLHFNKIVSNPGSIIKFTYSQAGKGYVLSAQGANTHTMLANYGEYYLTLTKQGKTYVASAYAKGFNIHLADERLHGNETEDSLGYMQPSGNDRQNWYITPLDASSADNYFGFQPTLTANGKDYLPFYADFAFTKYSDGIKAYYVDGVKERAGVARLHEITSNVIPAGVPMIIETASMDPSSNKVNIVSSNAAAPTDNLLSGVYFCSAVDLLNWWDGTSKDHNVYTLNDPTTMRVLAVEDGDLVLKKSTEKYIPANSFYLKVNADCADVVKFVDSATFDATTEPDPPTGIASVTADKNAVSALVYNLNGQCVSVSGLKSLPKGVYIVNGKKVVKR